MIAVSTKLEGMSAYRNVLMPVSSSAGAGLQLESLFYLPEHSAQEQQRWHIPVSEQLLARRVFSALADAKIWTSSVAMHLEHDTRDRLFRQLDLLHDADEWCDGDEPLHLDSYKTFVRFIVRMGGRSKPALALNGSGHLLAVWQKNFNRLSVEFLPNADVKWVISRVINGHAERAAGTTSSQRLMANLAPYNPNDWLKIAESA